MNMPLVLLNRRRRGALFPAALFALAEPGTWYDPSDLTTLFQDSAGTTPVTAPNQPVGRMLDKSGRGNHATQATSGQRPTYGVNPITGTRNLLTYTEQFDNADWAKSNVTVSGSQIVETSATGVHRLAQGVDVSAGSVHCLSVLARRLSGSRNLEVGLIVGASYVTYRIGLDTGTVVSNDNALGTALSSPSVTITAIGSDWRVALAVTVNSGTTGTALLGLVQGTSTNSYTGDGTSSLNVGNPQFELGSTATAYQKVVTRYEVTEAGIASASYIAFDGVDDSMVTPTITPGIDKAQAFAGVRKLSDVARGIVFELPSSGVRFEAPHAAATSFAFSSRGTLAPIQAIGSSYASPVTAVIAGIGGISTDTSILRVNGTQVAAVTDDQGTGDYLANVIYIGRRGGTTLPYNGRIYSLIVRFGPNLTTGQITSTESYVNSRTGAY